MEAEIFKYSDPDEMTDIAALEEEDLAIQSLHNGFLCTTDLY